MKSVVTDSQKIKEVLNRNVVEIIDRNHLERRLKSGQRLRIKFGIDPTSTDLHLGHSVALRKLKQLQELGHQIIFLIGDMTARIGDPSARVTARKPLSKRETTNNMKGYIQQAAKILDVKKLEVRYNSEWYEKKGVAFLMDLTSRFTYARLIERDDFQKRIRKNIDISMLELLYPLFQGYDSVALKSDLEIGGTDQKFNLLMGRKVQKKYHQPQQDIMTVPLLIGTDGINKMSKSCNNYISLKETPYKMYGKIMSIPDNLIWHYFELLSDLPIDDIREKKKAITNNILTPRDAKAGLAREVVAYYFGEQKALAAENEFERVFRREGLPRNIPEVKISEESLDILTLLVATKLACSKSEAKRLILQKGVKIDGKIESNWRKVVKLKKGQVLQVGKKKFVKIKPAS